MSHYTVAVITKTKPESSGRFSLDKDIEELLAPYNENKKVEPYVEMTFEELEECFLKGHSDTYTELYRSLPSLDKKQKYLMAYYGYEDIVDGMVYTTYNPKSKWDWYSIGGRWDDGITLKDGSGTNCAQIKDILFKRDVTEDMIPDDEKEEDKQEYEKLINVGDLYKTEYYKKKYPTFDEYLKETHGFSTYAIVDENGEWFEPAEMGWFGMGATPEEANDFEDEFYKVIEGKGDMWITLVDCHI